MGYRQKIEEAVTAMFELDRKNDAELERVFGLAADPIRDVLDLDGCHKIALDLLGIPEDNTLDYDYNNPSFGGKWPKGCFCRDSYLELWIVGAENAQEFIDECYASLKAFAENGDVFTKPRK